MTQKQKHARSKMVRVIFTESEAMALYGAADHLLATYPMEWTDKDLGRLAAAKEKLNAAQNKGH